MKRNGLWTLVLLAAWGIGLSTGAESALAADEGFVPIFDGKTLDGWHVSTRTGHGTGGRWVVQDGAIQGSQDKPGNGGIVITDAQYRDFEVALEMNNDYGPDSGLFLRSTEDGRCYQAMIDYHDRGSLMGVYGEGIGGFGALNFRTLGTPRDIEMVDHPAFPCPFTVEQWKELWKPGWNELRARITGNPPTIDTWINGVKTMEWKDKQKRLPDQGSIALQVHGGGDSTRQFVRYRNIRVKNLGVPDNVLTAEEKRAGWQLLFDGKTLDGWTTDRKEPSKVPVENGCINPHKCGGYMVIHEKPWTDFVWSMDFKIAKGCNSGIFTRVFSLEPKPGWDVGFNGLEVAIDDTTGSGYHDTGAIYDLAKPKKNMMRPAGAWNHIVVTCDRHIIEVELNGEQVTRMDLDKYAEPSKRPDGSTHKFTGIAYAKFPRTGYIGLQDHGSPCWYKNLKLLPLRAEKRSGKSE
ncbi:MAG TPA: DUF1080 domain-containing protein [Phycisphaerae bacterium]|nr:DUF1080 domain-containing protein [Phycisphaerae bacterium]HRY70403.1 DUF1080 domain-containing protein [Phycisphaerae bacterium]HSA28120.1 DUF1080 domain-containing protein [Phycisphaerae bacterium]